MRRRAASIDSSSSSDNEDVSTKPRQQQQPAKKKAKPAAATAAPAKGGYSMEAWPASYERERFLARDAAEASRLLRDTGIAVVPGLLDAAETARALDGLYGALEEAFPLFRRDRPDTWRQLRDNGAKHAMLLQTHGLGWCQAAVDVRQSPAMAQFWADLWTQRLLGRAEEEPPVEPSELLSSSDGVSVYLNRPEERGGFHRPGHDWLHWDRRPGDRMPSVQGFVNLLPTASAGAAAFEALAGSHRRQKAFVEAFPEAADKRFFLLQTQAQADFYARTCEHVCIAAAPGDLVLWDSRLIHCGRAALRGAQAPLERAVIYVSMQPRVLATPRDLELKRRAFARLLSTSHNAAAGVELFPKYPRVRCPRDQELHDLSRPVARAPALTPLGRWLFGLN